jgi:hypothetical protein
VDYNAGVGMMILQLIVPTSWYVNEIYMSGLGSIHAKKKD